MYTAQQIAAVINYNKNNNIFRITTKKRVVWDLRNIDVANLQQAGVVLKYAEDFAALKRAVRNELIAQKLV